MNYNKIDLQFNINAVMTDPTIKNEEMIIDINLDKTSILYTDHIIMTTNADGIVFDVGQKLGPTNKLRIVSRIGMSRDHAKKFLKELGKLLAMTDGQIETGKKN